MSKAFNKFAKYEGRIGAGLGGIGGYYATGKNNKNASFGDKMNGAFAGAALGGLAGSTFKGFKSGGGNYGRGNGGGSHGGGSQYATDKAGKMFTGSFDGMSKKEAKKAYHKFSKVHHPDNRTTGNHADFTNLNAEYKTFQGN